jgi:hypothetical protein
MIIYTIPANWNWDGKPRHPYVITHKWNSYLADLDRSAIRRHYRSMRRKGVGAYTARSIILDLLRIGNSRIESVDYVEIEVTQ